MDNYREKIVRIVERELKRTEEYQQRRDEYGNEEYILGCIMVKGDAFPKEVIAHAFVEDMGLELQFQVWRDEPRIRQKQAMWYDLTLFDVEGDFFGKLEQGYSILSVSDLFHCTAWNATEYLADEQNRDKENSCWKGMQRYLNYCKKHGITRNYLVKKEEYDGIDAMLMLFTWPILEQFTPEKVKDLISYYRVHKKPMIELANGWYHIEILGGETLQDGDYEPTFEFVIQPATNEEATINADMNFSFEITSSAY